jgi:hypothetical protein
MEQKKITFEDVMKYYNSLPSHTAIELYMMNVHNDVWQIYLPALGEIIEDAEDRGEQPVVIDGYMVVYHDLQEWADIAEKAPLHKVIANQFVSHIEDDPIPSDLPF